MIENCNDITIIIPTKDRLNWVKRIFIYYTTTKFDGVLLIGDSSNSINHNKLLEMAQFFNNLNICVHYYPKNNTEETLYELSFHISTKFSLFLADDDIIITNNLAISKSFLINNNGYIGVTGQSYYIETQNGLPFSKRVSFINQYDLVEADEEISVDRINGFFTKVRAVVFTLTYSNIFKEWLTTIIKLNKYHQTFIFGEIIGAMIYLKYGKIKKLNLTYCIRQGHNDNTYTKIKFYDWIGNEDWTNSHKLLRQNIQTAITYNNLDLSKSLEISNEILSKFYYKTFSGLLKTRNIKTSFYIIYKSKLILFIKNIFKISSNKNMLTYFYNKFNSNYRKIQRIRELDVEVDIYLKIIENH
jgi:glycosyltransferase domain-containing protein